MKHYLQLTFALLFYSVASFAQNIAKGEIDAFVARTGAQSTVDKATNSLSFLRFPIGKSLKLTGVSSQEKALYFMRANAGLFAIRPDRDTYLVKGNKRDKYGLEHVELQQHFKGVPVFDGTLKFHFNKSSELASLNGNFITISKLNTVPSISKEEAGSLAIRHVKQQKLGKLKAPLKVNKSTLYVFQKGLVQGYQGPKHLVYEVEVRNDADVREFLYIDAHSKELVEQFTGMHSIDRKLYEVSVAPGNLIWQESDGTSGSVFNGLDKWQKSEVESSGQIYNFMNTAFGFESYDDHNAPMITINNNPLINCPNANWNGVTANYCTGIAADDVVAHEWGHAYTEYTSNLIYAWQAGALNEAYSDIWGETVDQINGYMDTGETNAIRNDCGSSNRWQMGESTTDGAIRDMWDPTCFNNPGKVSDPQYHCATSDEGGVHTNSGILGHAYALLVDGGTYNKQTINGIGLTKAAHIFWYAQANYMTRTTDFSAQADFLEASLTDLIGMELAGLSTTETAVPYAETISAADLNELKKVILAVELRTEKDCGYPPLLLPIAAICSGGEEGNAIFFENFESGIGEWTVSNLGSTGNWTPRNWVLDETPPQSRPGKVVYGFAGDAGNCVDNFQNGKISLTSPPITIPVGASGPFNMAFDHYVATEPGYDGGNISYRINGAGAWILVKKSDFTENGYNVTLATAAEESDNPLQGQPGFSGTDLGSLSGSWGQSRIDLEKLGLLAGQTIEFRWDLGTDGCNGYDGWYIDDVRVYSCALPTVQFVSSATIVNEAEGITTGAAPIDCLKYVEKTITVRINKAPSQPVTVTLSTPTGTATQGITADYSITPNAFTLQSGALSQDVVVRIYNDAYVEGPETAVLNYTLSTGGDAYPETYNQQHTITINDDEIVPGVIKSDLLSANFNTGLPSGWTVPGGGTFPNTWAVVQLNGAQLDPDGPPMLFLSSFLAGEQPMSLDKAVESAPFNTVGMSSIELSFIESFSTWDGAGNIFAEEARVDVWDGTTWQNVLTQTEADGSSGSLEAPATRNISIPIAYANDAMKVRFRYISNFDDYWAIDNVKVIGSVFQGIQNAVSASPDEQYLGPNATAYFYDPASGGLIAKIKNLSDHDYGCTQVTVDRAGVDEIDWLGTYSITKKTFKVTPTNNNPNGEYEITLYYKASELLTFNGSDIKSMGKSEGGIGAGNVASTSFAEVQVGSAFNTDFAYTATFDSGFSGFGLSDAPPVGALPVTLVKFEGKHTPEGNVLNWSTSSEVNNEYFAIEKTISGKNFTEIGRVAGNGNSAVTNSYNFTDSNYPKGISYYRLKQVDRDGKSTYSKIISIDALNSRELKFFPNPVQSMFTMELPDANLKAVNVRLINSAGQEMLVQEKVKIINGSFSLDVDKLPTGIYQVILSGEKSSYNLSVIKL